MSLHEKLESDSNFLQPKAKMCVPRQFLHAGKRHERILLVHLQEDGKRGRERKRDAAPESEVR